MKATIVKWLETAVIKNHYENHSKFYDQASKEKQRKPRHHT